MKKDFLWSLMAIMIAMTMSVSFISCNDDDDNNISHDIDYVSALTGIIDRESGLRLKSFSSRELHYSNNGVLESVTASYDNMEEQYNLEVLRR